MYLVWSEQTSRSTLITRWVKAIIQQLHFPSDDGVAARGASTRRPCATLMGGMEGAQSSTPFLLPTVGSDTKRSRAEGYELPEGCFRLMVAMGGSAVGGSTVRAA